MTAPADAGTEALTAACERPCRRLETERIPADHAEASRQRAEAVAGEARLRAEDLRLMLRAMAGAPSARSEEPGLPHQQLERANECAARLQAEPGAARDDLTLAEAAIDRAQAARHEAERLRRLPHGRSSGRLWLRLGYAWRGW